MKKLLLIFLMSVGLASVAAQPEISVFALNISPSNAYGFQPASEIVAQEVSKNIGTLRANDVITQPIVKKFKQTGVIDVENLNMPAGKTLLILGYVEDKNFSKLDLWDVLKLSGDFALDFPYEWTTKVILVDNKDGVVLWQKTYVCPLTSKTASFIANESLRAQEHYQKVRSYSKNVIARDVQENVYRRLNPKAIDYASNIKKVPENSEGIGLKYYKRGIPVKITRPEETFEQQLLKDDSFSL